MLLISFSFIPRSSAGKNIGYCEAGNIGDTIRPSPIVHTSAEILRQHNLFLGKSQPRASHHDPRAYPAASLPSDRLQWMIATVEAHPRLYSPFKSISVSDARAVEYSFVRGVLAARRLWGEKQPTDTETMTAIRTATNATRFGGSRGGIQFNRSGSLVDNMKWALRLSEIMETDNNRLPGAHSSEAEDFFAFTIGNSALHHYNNASHRLTVPREVASINGETRVFARHRPRAQNANQNSQSTVFLLHGISDEQVPDQHPSYTQIVDVADKLNFQVIFGVGSPQHYSAQHISGQGALGWRPSVESSTAYMEGIIDQLAARGELNPNRVFAVGHSNGGIFLTHLIAARPNLLAGVGLYGAGKIETLTEVPPAPKRKTPLSIRVGLNDRQYLEPSRDLHRFAQSWFGTTDKLLYEEIPGKGHCDINTVDYAAFLNFFKGLPGGQ